MTDSKPYNRRDLLKYTGVGGVVGLAGCTGGNNDGQDDGTEQATNTTEATTVEETTKQSDIKTGGKPVVGLVNEPQAFNPLVTSDAAAWSIMDQMYLRPIARDPKNPTKPKGILFKDWSFDPDSLQGKVQLYEGLSWSDGKEFTAEDVAFTLNYLMEKKGHRYESNANKFKEVGTSGKHTVEFTLNTEIAALFTPFTGAWYLPMLPPQTWEGVDDYQKFEPDELLGVGGYKWGSSDPGNWYELQSRRDEFPDEIHPGPYVDKLRYLVFGDSTSLINALKNGEVDLTYESITPNRAFQLQNKDNVKVWNAKSRGYNYVAMNMRRVPFDDKKFRQSLGFAYPFDYLVNTLRKGLSTPGDYPAAKIYEPWRPDDFSTPFDHGPYQTSDGKLDVQKVRNFLSNANGKHDYSWGPVKSSQVTGNKEIRVDGKLLTKAHTDNDGNAGQGPIGLVMTPPSSSPVVARASARFVENLNKVGIPAKKVPVAENSQPQRIWGQENFDMWESNWIWMPQPHFYLSFWLHGDKADMDSSKKSYHLNPMGYSGADKLIDKVETTYNPKKQKQAARKALATIYEDHPVIITEYPNRLHATTKKYKGWVKMPGGISQTHWSFLNVHKA